MEGDREDVAEGLNVEAVPYLLRVSPEERGARGLEGSSHPARRPDATRVFMAVSVHFGSCL